MQSPMFLDVLLFCLSVPTLVLGYPMSGASYAPVYGTKRYNRPVSSPSAGAGGLQRASSLAWRQPRYYPAEQTYAGAGDSQEEAPLAAASYYYYPDARRRRYQQQQQLLQQQQPQYMYHPARYLINDPVEDLEDTMRREEEGWYDDGDDAAVLRPLAPTDYYPAYYAKYNPRVRQQQQQSFFPEDYYYDNPYDWYRPQQLQMQPPRTYLDEFHEDDLKDAKTSQQQQQQQQQLQQLTSSPSFRHYERSPYDYTDADEEDDAWINWGSKRSSGAKAKSAAPASTSAPGPAAGSAGQKEIVQPRPALQPFRMPDLLMDDEDDVYHEKRSAPGVYNTIRRLIAMEKDLEQENDKKAPLKKRFVASGEDFVQELNSLKKRRA